MSEVIVEQLPSGGDSGGRYDDDDTFQSFSDNGMSSSGSGSIEDSSDIDSHNSIFGSSTDSLYELVAEKTDGRTTEERKEWSVRFAASEDTRPAAMRAARQRRGGAGTSPIPDDTLDSSPGVARPASSAAPSRAALQSRGGSGSGGRGKGPRRSGLGLDDGLGFGDNGNGNDNDIDDDNDDDSFFVQEDWGTHDAVLSQGGSDASATPIPEDDDVATGTAKSGGDSLGYHESFSSFNSGTSTGGGGDDGSSSSASTSTGSIGARRSAAPKVTAVRVNARRDDPTSGTGSVGQPRAVKSKARPRKKQPTTTTTTTSAAAAAAAVAGQRPSTRRRAPGKGVGPSFKSGRTKRAAPLQSALSHSPFLDPVNLGGHLTNKRGNQRLLAPPRFTPDGDPFHDNDRPSRRPQTSHSTHSRGTGHMGGSRSSSKLPADFVYDPKEYALLLSAVMHDRDLHVKQLRAECAQLRVAAKQREKRLDHARDIDNHTRAEQLRKDIVACRALLAKARQGLVQEESEHARLLAQVEEKDMKRKKGKFLRNMKKKIRQQHQEMSIDNGDGSHEPGARIDTSVTHDEDAAAVADADDTTGEGDDSITRQHRAVDGGGTPTRSTRPSSAAAGVRRTGSHDIPSPSHPRPATSQTRTRPRALPSNASPVRASSSGSRPATSHSGPIAGSAGGRPTSRGGPGGGTAARFSTRAPPPDTSEPVRQTRDAAGKAAMLQGRIAVQELTDALEQLKICKNDDAQKMLRDIAAATKKKKKLLALKASLETEIKQNELAVRALLGGYKTGRK